MIRAFSQGALVLVGFLLAACGGDDSDEPAKAAGAGGDSAGTGGAGGSSAPGGTGGGGTSGGAGESSSTGGTSGTGGDPPMTLPGSTPTPMPLISRGVPAFSSGAVASAEFANDDRPGSAWVSNSIPAWLAYDLSGVPEADREQVLVQWIDPQTPDYLNEPPKENMQLPIDYTIEIHDADGGGEPPEDGWTIVETVTGNYRSGHQRLIDFAGSNWIRVNVTKSSDPAGVAFDLAVHSAPEGATDSWLFMGDSITFLSTAYAFSNLPALVNERAEERWPAILPAAIGGTNTNTAMEALEETIADFPGRFVTLNYGTNDTAKPEEYRLEDLVQRVIDAGKVPAIPLQPWSDVDRVQEGGPVHNAIIEELYERYPEIYRGPDLWAVFDGRTDLMPSGNVHPNDEGEEALRQAWADAMTR